MSRAGGMARYELAPGPGTPAHTHPHLVCSDCNTVSCLPVAGIEVPAVEGPWAVALESASLQLQGQCPDC